MRFQKRIKVVPGVTLNLSKKGVSTSLGTTGARVTYGHGKKRTTVGIPGTGISHSVVESTSNTSPAAASQGSKVGAIAGAAVHAIWWVAVGLFAITIGVLISILSSAIKPSRRRR